MNFAAIGTRIFPPVKAEGETVSSRGFLRRNNLTDGFAAVIDVKPGGISLKFVGVAHGVDPSYE